MKDSKREENPAGERLTMDASASMQILKARNLQAKVTSARDVAADDVELEPRRSEVVDRGTICDLLMERL
jgi:hypothetical protein